MPIAVWSGTTARSRSSDDIKLLFFHFYGVKRSGGYYFNSHRLYHAPFSSLMKHRLYEPYTAALAEAERVVAPYLKDQQIETIRKPVVASPGDRMSNVLRKTRMMANPRP